jgi:hypothetical protein
MRVPDQLVDLADELLPHVHHHGLEQVRLGGEVAEHRPDRHTGPRGHGLGGGRRAILGEHVAGRLEDPETVAAGVGTHGPPPAGVRWHVASLHRFPPRP